MKWISRRIKEKRGNAIVFLAISITALIGMAALVTDVGMMTFNKSKLQNAVDAAALAGAHEIPEDTATGSAVAVNYLSENDEAVGKLVGHNISFSDSNSKITVEATYKVDFMFAKVIGMNSSNVTVRAAAINGPAKKVAGGLRPFGVVWDDSYYDENVKVTLKLSNWTKKNDEPEGGDVGPGNYGAVGLDGSGAAVYKDTIVDGSFNYFSVGQKIPTETGNMVGPTDSGLEDLIDNEGLPVFIYVPLVDTLDVHGHKDVTIMGFSSFKIVDYKKQQGNNKALVTGYFEEHVTPGIADPNGTDYGLRAVNLVE